MIDIYFYVAYKLPSISLLALLFVRLFILSSIFYHANNQNLVFDGKEEKKGEGERSFFVIFF